jgi:uncharacterized membrane protein
MKVAYRLIAGLPILLGTASIAAAAGHAPVVLPLANFMAEEPAAKSPTAKRRKKFLSAPTR